MNILITGAAGFIGHNWANYLCKKYKKFKIYGIDNLDNYYSVNYKKARLSILKKNKNFYFTKLDIRDKSKLATFFKKNKFSHVYHFAAQAGDRYSLENPKKYVDVNINGFINICENLVKNKIKKFIYASSSSVYGDISSFPVSENFKTIPKNIYGYSKLSNEIVAKYYSDKYQINSFGLRFFTVFGNWGRPDMFIIKLLNSIKKNNDFHLNNSGNHFRDFTHISFVLTILDCTLISKFRGHEIFNICSNKPILIKKLVNLIINKKYVSNIKNVARHPADVLKTHGSNKKVLNFFKIKNNKINFRKNLVELIDWYEKNKIYNIF